jgi:hypothetical protein
MFAGAFAHASQALVVFKDATGGSAVPEIRRLTVDRNIAKPNNIRMVAVVKAT